MIVKSLPYNISVLVLNKISLRVFYVSIFLVIFMSFIDFVFSKIRKLAHIRITLEKIM